MTLKIKLSELARVCITPEAFAARVNAYASAMTEYWAHLEGVKADAANEALAPDQRRVAFPSPSEDALIINSVRHPSHGFLGASVPDYEFVAPSLPEKKTALFAEVSRMEAEAQHAVMPPAKTRHWHFLEADISVRLAKGIATDEDDAFLTEQSARKAKQQTIARWAAKLEHDIDDLTDETIDAFVLEPFSG